MQSSKNYRTEAEIIFRKWLEDTVEVLEKERARLKVKKKEALKNSLRQVVISIASDELGGEIHFLTRGRFVDMGAGRRRSVDALSIRKKPKKRKAKKWYSPAFYGRLNDLQGVLGIKLMERSLEAIRQGIL